MKKYILPLLSIFFCLIPTKALGVENEMVIAQMNSCVNTLTNIINNKSMSVLEHETDQLLNNLTMQQMVGLSEIAEFRGKLIDGIGQLGITEEERHLIKRLNSIKQDNMKWRVFSNALNNTMMITGGGNIGVQAGFQALVTAARAGVEYKVAQNDMQMEELQAMWELRKEDLKTFVNLRKEALKIIFSLYQKYNLKESDRLTEQTSQQFQKIISETDATKMVRLLLDNSTKFGHLADYYYYLGMGYIDMNNIPKAMAAFAKYDALYAKAPIYRINEKSGLISLTRLAYLENLSNQEIEKELINVQKNLPSNAMALIQCAIVYDVKLKNTKKAISVLRSALDDENVSDKAAIIITGSIILPKISTQSQEYNDFFSAFANQKSIDLDAALNMCIAKKENIFDFLSKNFIISDYYHNAWHFGNTELNDKFIITLPQKYSIDLSKVQLFVEEKKGEKITVSQYNLRDVNSIKLADIDKVKAFKNNPNLKYLYMYSVGDDLFMVKDNLNYSSIEKEDFPRQSEFTLGSSDLKDIVKFLQKNENKTDVNEVVAEKVDVSKKSIFEKGIEIIYPNTYLHYSLYKSLYKHLKNQSDVIYIKLVFDDSRNLVVCYKFDRENEKLLPCYTQYDGKIHFVNKSYMADFGYAPQVSTSSKTGLEKQESKDNIKSDVSKTQPKQEIKSEKPWWKVWGDDEDAQSKSEPQKQASKTESEVKKVQPKQETKSEKPWWKVWGGDEDVQSKSEPQKQDTKTKSEVKKVQPKQETKSEKPWWKVWGDDEETQSKSESQEHNSKSKSEVHKKQSK